MDHTVYQVIRRAFNRDQPKSEGEQAADEQAKAYRALAVWMSALWARLPSERNFRSVSNAGQNAVSNVERAFKRFTPIALLEFLPQASQDSISILINWIETQKADETLISCIVAAYIWETRRVQTDDAGTKVDTQSVLVDAEVASYAAWDAYEETARFWESRLSTVNEDFRHRSDEIILKVTERLQEAGEAVINLQKNNSETLSSLSDTKTALNATAREALEHIATSEQALSTLNAGISHAQAQLDALKEGIGTLSAKKLWDTRASSSNRAFWWSSLVLALLLVGVPVGAFLQLDGVLAILKHIGDATIQGLPPVPSATQLAVASISRLVVVTLPVILYLWVIRLVIRFNARSLMLVDDARQRHTMMDTYFHLIAESAAVKEDRALILAALFRPTPGQPNETVEPPNFTELLDKAISK